MIINKNPIITSAGQSSEKSKIFGLLMKCTNVMVSIPMNTYLKTSRNSSYSDI